MSQPPAAKTETAGNFTMIQEWCEPCGRWIYGRDHFFKNQGNACWEYFQKVCASRWDADTKGVWVVECWQCDREVYHLKRPHGVIVDREVYPQEGKPPIVELSWYGFCPACRKRERREYMRDLMRKRRATVRQDIPCSHCGQKFTPRRSDAKFCRHACRQAAYLNRRAASNA